jgi:NDP-sugar pyrophosphorylase family protein
MKMPLQVVIPAAGIGSRFKSVGINTPKPLIEVGRTPMILWVIANLELGPNDSVYVICQREDEMRTALTKYLVDIDFEVTFLEIEGLTSGPASTVALALPSLISDVPIIVANSDQYVSNSLSSFVSSAREKNFDGTILTMEASGAKWSYIGRDSEGRIERVVEKSEISNEATVGIYAWSSPELLNRSIDFLRDENLLVNGEYYVAPSYGYLFSQNLQIGTFSVGNHGEAVHGLGTPDDLEMFLKHPKFALFEENIHSYYSPRG